jgi:hypothetical protein
MGRVLGLVLESKLGDGRTLPQYAHDGQGNWITFDDEASFAAKLDCLEDEALGAIPQLFGPGAFDSARVAAYRDPL